MGAQEELREELQEAVLEWRTANERDLNAEGYGVAHRCADDLADAAEKLLAELAK